VTDLKYNDVKRKHETHHAYSPKNQIRLVDKPWVVGHTVIDVLSMMSTVDDAHEAQEG